MSINNTRNTDHMDNMTVTGDVETTETESGAKTPTGSIRRFYTINGDLVARESGVDTRLTSVEEIPDSWKVEGAINAFIKGKVSIEDILSGKAIPDRSPPSAKAVKGGQRGKVSMLSHAIAAAKAIDMTKVAKAAGEKVNKDQLNAKALAWVLNLSSEQKAELGKLAVVQIELAKLKGEEGSLDAVLGNKEENDAA